MSPAAIPTDSFAVNEICPGELKLISPLLKSESPELIFM